MKRVCIVGGDTNIARMFIARGWSMFSNPNDSDLIQFTGGSDVDPSYYNEEKHATTSSSPARDASESHIYRQMLAVGIPMAGICRGGQFLNVMNGGSMYQNVDNHCRTHIAYTTEHPERIFTVTSTHHQMMRPSDEAELILYANESTYRETAIDKFTDPHVDVEAVIYPKTKCLCFQPHPEYLDINHPCQDLYFELLERFFK
jgi:gamma-glutamyl-gamma-aminobutyrate hydrolase PuuD